MKIDKIVTDKQQPNSTKIKGEQPPTAPKIAEDLGALNDELIDGLVIINRDGKIEFINPTIKRLTGHQRNEVIGRNINEMIPQWFQPEDVEKIKNLLVTVFNGKIPQEQFSACITRNGQNIPVIVSTTFSKNKHGKPITIVLTLKDISYLKNGEKFIHQKIDNYQNLLDSISIGIYLTTPAGKIFYTNKAFVDILNYDTRESLLAVKATNLFKNPGDRERWKSLMEHEGVVHNFDVQLKKYDGSEIWVTDNARAIRGSDGRILYYEGSIQDITERKQAQDALKKSEEQFRTIADFTYNWEHWINSEGEDIYISPSVERITGYKPEEFLQDPRLLFDIIQLEDKEKVREHFKAHSQHRQPSLCEFRINKRDGKMCWIEHLCQSVYDENGKWLGRRVSNIDITERKLFEEVLRLSEKRLKEAEQISHLGHWELDLKTNTLHWSDEIYKIFGLNQANFKATYEGFLEIIHPDDREYVNKAYTDSLKNKTKYEIIHRLKLNDGTEKYVTETCETKYDKKGNPLRSIGTTQDITHRMLAEQEIRRKNEVLKAINSVFQETLVCESDVDVAYMCINMAEKLTGSEFGLIGEINEKGRFDTITYGDLGWAICKMEESEAIKLSKNMIIRGIWGQAILKGKSQIVNDSASHQNRVGTPKGHPQIKSFLGVPLKMSGKTIGMIGLANKKGGYNTDDLEAIESLSVAFVEALMRKRAELKIKNSLKEKTALIKEIHHRVKNNLNVIVSLLQLQSQKLKDLEGIVALQLCIRRIYSMALVHEKLYGSEDMANVDMKDYIETLIPDLVYSFGDLKRLTTEIKINEIYLNIDLAIPLGIIINELITNTLKHAFPEGRKGKIDISLRRLKSFDSGLCELIVHDDGIGLPGDLDIENIDVFSNFI